MNSTTTRDAASPDVAAQLLVSVEEGGRLLDISPRHAWALVTGGQIPSVKVGRCRRVVVADLAAYIERCRLAERESAAPVGERTRRDGGRSGDVSTEHRSR